MAELDNKIGFQIRVFHTTVMKDQKKSTTFAIKLVVVLFSIVIFWGILCLNGNFSFLESNQPSSINLLFAQISNDIKESSKTFVGLRWRLPTKDSLILKCGHLQAITLLVHLSLRSDFYFYFVALFCFFLQP